MQQRKCSPVYRSATAQFHSLCDLRREQQNDKTSFFNDDSRKKIGHFVAFHRTVLEN